MGPQVAEPQRHPKSTDFYSNCALLVNHSELGQMNASTIISITKMCIHGTLVKIQWISVLSEILVLSDDFLGCPCGPATWGAVINPRPVADA